MTIKVFCAENLTEIVFTDGAIDTTVYLDQAGTDELVFKMNLAAQAYEHRKKFKQDALDGQKEAVA